MVDSYEYSGIKNPPLLTCEPLRTTIDRMPFKEVGTYGFQFKWNDKLDTALYALLVSRNIKHIFCWLVHSMAFQRKFHFDNVCCEIFSLRILYVELQICLALEYPRCMKGVCVLKSLFDLSHFYGFYERSWLPK